MDFEDVKEEIVSTFNDRLKNPFVFTFIISWLAWNWLLVYQFFSFPKSFTLEQKTNIINNYIQRHWFDNMSGIPLLSSICISIVYLLFSFGFTMLFNFYNTTIKSEIFKWTAKGENIPRSIYDSLYKRHDRLKASFDNSKKLWHEIEERNIEAFDELSKMRIETRTISNNLEASNFELENIKKTNVEIQKKYNEMQMFFERETEEFVRLFANKKTWYVLAQMGKEDYKSYEKLKYDENYLVRDAKSGEIKYEIKNLRFSREDRVIHFKQHDFNNSEVLKIVYLFDAGYGVYRGFEKDAAGNPVRNLIYTQDMKNLEHFKLL